MVLVVTNRESGQVGVLGILQSQVMLSVCSGNGQLLAMVKRMPRNGCIFVHILRRNILCLFVSNSSSGRLELLGKRASRITAVKQQRALWVPFMLSQPVENAMQLPLP